MQNIAVSSVYSGLHLHFISQTTVLYVTFGYSVNFRERPHLIVLADELKGLHAEPELSVVVSWVDLNCGVNFAPVKKQEKWFTNFPASPTPLHPATPSTNSS